MDLNNIEDFLDNKRFVKWLQSDDAELDAFWQSWLRDHPERKDLFYHAVATWKLIGEAPENWPEGEVDGKLAKLKDLLEEAPEARRYRPVWYYAAAAVLVLAMCIGFFGRQSANDKKEGLAKAELQKSVFKTVANRAKSPLLINLADGTSALLSPGSALSFPEKFEADRRVVRLNGEAFFEVEKNAAVPFYVQTSLLTTKVLGTSFRVRSFEREADASVSVLSGKVEVKAAISKAGNSAGSPGVGGEVVLGKNETVTLRKDTDELLKSGPVNPPGELSDVPGQYSFDLKFIPASEVFSALERIYGVRVEYDAKRFGRCTLTADLEDVPFLKKVELICAGIDASYSLNGSVIRISGRGCLE